MHVCHCTPPILQRYRNRLSGPLLDRIDLHIDAPRVPHQELSGVGPSEDSGTIRRRVEEARLLQRERLGPFGLHANSQMQARHLKRFCSLDPASEALLGKVTERLGLSARSYARILKVARTIADLSGENQILPIHLSEAIQYRSLDRKLH